MLRKAILDPYSLLHARGVPLAVPGRHDSHTLRRNDAGASGKCGDPRAPARNRTYPYGAPRTKKLPECESGRSTDSDMA